MGAEAIKELLRRVTVEELSDELRLIMRTETSQIKKLKAAKRLKVVDAFRKSGHHPDWMILDVIPVIPPELRPRSEERRVGKECRDQKTHASDKEKIQNTIRGD